MVCLIQPCAGKEARRHENISMLHPVHYSEYHDVLTPDQLTMLSLLFPGGIAYFWGNTEGKRGINRRHVDAIAPGDTACFTRHGCAYACAEIVYVFRNREFADRLWGKDSKNSLSYEWMYATQRPSDIRIPYSRINMAAGYKPHNVFVGVRRLSCDVSDFSTESVSPRVC